MIVLSLIRKTDVKLLNEYSPSSLSNNTVLPTGCFSLPPDFSTIRSPFWSFLVLYCFASTSRYSILSKLRLNVFVKLAFRITPTLTNGPFFPFQRPLILLHKSPIVLYSQPFFILQNSFSILANSVECLSTAFHSHNRICNHFVPCMQENSASAFLSHLP